MIIIKCDKCGVAEEKKKGDVSTIVPKGWYPLTCRFGYSGSMTYHVCPECRKALKIPDEKPVGEDVAQRFLELLGELVAEEVEAQVCQ
jgi:hypothetical protein